MLNKTLIYIFTVNLSILFLFFGNRIASNKTSAFNQQKNGQEVQKARVVEIRNKTTEQHESEDSETILESSTIEFSAKILSGYKKGMLIHAFQTTDPFFPVAMKEIQKGDKVLIYRDEASQSGKRWILGEYLRTDTLFWLGALFFLFLIVFGGFQGINTIISLIFTCAAIFTVLIPSILNGHNIYFWALIVCFFIVIMTLLIVSGLTPKSYAAGLGCFSGIALSGILTLIMNKLLKLTGVLNDESLYLLYLNPENPINLKAVIFAAIIIGAIGAIMDVAMSVSSSLFEIRKKAPSIPFLTLFRSGLTIGRDMMGTMANTLILAYIGSSLSLVLLLAAYHTSLLELLNRELIVTEILQALIGSIGILFTIPFTSLISAGIYTRKRFLS